MKNTEELQIRNIVKNLYESSVDASYSLAITGGGIKVVDWILSVPGASNRILEVVLPYSGTSLNKYLGSSIQKSVSLGTALKLANKSYEEALCNNPDKNNLVGIGVTASLETNRFKRSQNKFYMVAKSHEKLFGYSLVFEKGSRDRVLEDQITSKVIISLMYEVLDLKNDFKINLFRKEKLIRYSKLEKLIDQLIQAKKDYVFIDQSGLATDDIDFSGVLIPGSFNPLHRGHIGILEYGLKAFGHFDVFFELSISNVDKPSLNRDELIDRVRQFRGLSGIIITRSTTFLQKSKLFPGCKFIVGIDTMERIWDEKYYQSKKDLQDTISDFNELGVKFFVAGRSNESGDFKSLSNIEIDERFEKLVSEIPEKDFRVDISSKDLR